MQPMIGFRTRKDRTTALARHRFRATIAARTKVPFHIVELVLDAVAPLAQELHRIRLAEEAAARANKPAAQKRLQSTSRVRKFPSTKQDPAIEWV